jgi:hypothetical protein
MADPHGKVPDRPQPEGYHSEYIRLPADDDLALLVLGSVIREKSSRGWRLLRATKEPSGNVILLEWDTSESSSE